MIRELNRPIVIGLTGGIGTGKSNVLNTMVSLGADGIDADTVAREVMTPGGPAYQPILEAFGAGIAREGQIDRRELGRVVFADAGALAKLERIVHPMVANQIARRVAATTAPVVVIEAIKLVEAGLSSVLCDRIWVTTCSRRQQYARLAANRGMTAAQVRERLAHQMRPEVWIASADRVISTSGTLAETRLDVVTAWSELAIELPRAKMRAGGIEDAEGIAAILNAVVREGGQSAVDRFYTTAQERAYLRKLPPVSRLTMAELGIVPVGFQLLEPYATYTGAMSHVAKLGSFMVSTARKPEIAGGLMLATFATARESGFEKIVAQVRADNQPAQSLYESHGFKVCGRLARQIRLDGRQIDRVLLEYFL